MTSIARRHLKYQRLYQHTRVVSVLSLWVFLLLSAPRYSTRVGNRYRRCSILYDTLMTRRACLELRPFRH